MVFIELPLFARYLRLTDDELRAVQRDILDNPHCGDLIPGGRGLRKMRAAIGGRGKRGGGRIIYYLLDGPRHLLLGVCLFEDRAR